MNRNDAEDLAETSDMNHNRNTTGLDRSISYAAGEKLGDKSNTGKHGEQRRRAVSDSEETARKRREYSSGYGTGQTSRESQETEDDVFLETTAIASARKVLKRQYSLQEPIIEEKSSSGGSGMASSANIEASMMCGDNEDQPGSEFEESYCSSYEVSASDLCSEDSQQNGASDCSGALSGAAESEGGHLPDFKNLLEDSSSVEVTPSVLNELASVSAQDVPDVLPLLPLNMPLSMSSWTSSTIMDECHNLCRDSATLKLLELFHKKFFNDEIKYRMQKGDDIVKIMQEIDELCEHLPHETVAPGAEAVLEETSWSESDTCTVPQTVADMEMTSVQWDGDVHQERMMSCLRMAAQCGEVCSNNECNIGKELWTLLNEHLAADNTEVTAVDRQIREDKKNLRAQILNALMLHAYSCEEELRCAVPWCNVLREMESSDCEEIFLELRYRMRYLGLVQFMEPKDESRTCVEVLCTSLVECGGATSVHQEGIGWKFSCYVEDFNSNVVLARQGSQHVVIKKMKASNVPEICDVLQRLGSCNERSIATPLWFLHQPAVDRLYVCSLFSGNTLRQYMREEHAGGLPWNKLVRLAHELLNATDFLHGHNILYLAWESSNITIGTDHRHPQVKLCNFSYALPVPGTGPYSPDEDMMEDLALLLPPAIVPPEIYRLSMVYTPATDMWGVGCLLYEMAESCQVHQDLRHEEPARRRELVRTNPVPDCTATSGSIARLVRMCCRIDPEERETVAQLRAMLDSNCGSPS